MFCNFSNNVEFIHDVEDGEYNNFHNIEKILVEEFGNCNPHKLINVLNQFNLLHFFNLSEESESVEDMDIDSLRENIIQLVRDKFDYE